MTSIDLEDHEWRALYRICRDFFERTSWADRPGASAERLLLEERAIAKRLCGTSSQ